MEAACSQLPGGEREAVQVGAILNLSSSVTAAKEGGAAWSNQKAASVTG